MTSFTTDDRISCESQSISDYRTRIGFTNLIDDCNRLSERCKHFETVVRLNMIANTIADIGKDYQKYKQNESGNENKQMTLNL